MANHLYYGDNLDILREHILEHGLTRVGERDFLAQSGTASHQGVQRTASSVPRTPAFGSA